MSVRPPRHVPDPEIALDHHADHGRGHFFELGPGNDLNDRLVQARILLEDIDGDGCRERSSLIIAHFLLRGTASSHESSTPHAVLDAPTGCGISPDVFVAEYETSKTRH